MLVEGNLAKQFVSAPCSTAPLSAAPTSSSAALHNASRMEDEQTPRRLILARLPGGVASESHRGCCNSRCASSTSPLDSEDGSTRSLAAYTMSHSAQNLIASIRCSFRDAQGDAPMVGLFTFYGKFTATCSVSCYEGIVLVYCIQPTHRHLLQKA